MLTEADYGQMIGALKEINLVKEYALKNRRQTNMLVSKRGEGRTIT
jgi:hypothetical protein